jgi:hypothetical protein
MKSALFCDEKCPFLWWKVPFFVMKSALFVQANVAVNTKLTSKAPFLLGKFPRYGTTVWYDGKIFLPPPPVANINGKIFLGALFNTLNS